MTKGMIFYFVFGLQRWQGSVVLGKNFTLEELMTIQHENHANGSGSKHRRRPRLLEPEHNVVHEVNVVRGAHKVASAVGKAHRWSLPKRRRGLHLLTSQNTLMPWRTP